MWLIYLYIYIYYGDKSHPFSSVSPPPKNQQINKSKPLHGHAYIIIGVSETTPNRGNPPGLSLDLWSDIPYLGDIGE